MARRLFYRVFDNGDNFISGEEWEEIHTLQDWYNIEFFWTGGKLDFRRFVVFPNSELAGVTPAKVRREFSIMKEAGLSEEEIIARLESRKLIIVKRGGYEDGMIGSGFTRVADNEFNAFLVVDFLFKVSRIAPTASIEVFDEGDFVKTHSVSLNNGDCFVTINQVPTEILEDVRTSRKVFAIVNPNKYDGHPDLTNYVGEFNELVPAEKAKVVANWNWLGHESKVDYDYNGDDFCGYDLNQKLRNLFFI